MKPWRFRIFLLADDQRSIRALASLRALCEARLRDGYDLEVIDLRLHPELAAAYQILAVPTTVRISPEPWRKVIGDLSFTEEAVRGLELPERGAAS